MARPMPPHDARMFGDEKLALDGNLLDFWTWAFGDLCDDDIKGIFAEWMVARLLGIPTKRRVSWANSDLVTADGVQIEVKSSAYWQSWKLVDPSGEDKVELTHACASDATIAFKGLQARNSEAIAASTEQSQFKSDLYVFAFQCEKMPDRWNALDLNQWQFYVFSVEQLRAFAGNRVRLVTLRERQGGPLKAAQFVEVARQLIERIANERQLPTSASQLQRTDDGR